MPKENFYYGTSYPLEADSGDLFTGYRTPAASIGLATDARTANQIAAISDKISSGTKTVEMSTISPQVFDSIPTQHLVDIKRLSKLTGTDITVHGPAVEPSGYTERGWSEANRQQSENEILSAVERSHKLDAKGNVPVTFHPSYMLPEEKVIIKEKGKLVPKSMLAADMRTGEIIQIKEKERYFPEEGGIKKEFDPESELTKRNDEAWVQTLNNLNHYAMRGTQAINESFRIFEDDKRKQIAEQVYEIYGEEGSEEAQKFMEKLPKEMVEPVEDSLRNLDHGSIFLRDSYNMLRELYNRVYKDATPEDKAKLNAFAERVRDEVEAGVEKDPKKLQRFAEIIEDGVKTLKQTFQKEAPQLFQPFNNFIIEKDAETFSNVALKSYKKMGEKAPVISIENPPAGTALSRGSEIKELVEKTRQKFVKKAVQEGMSESQAKSAAEKLIGATWDVGHINMLRKYGYDKVDLVKETEKVAPYVKHVHLSDNFGFQHTELPMGMGNVPLKEMMKKLGKKADEIKKVVEAAQWYEHFKTPPMAETYEALGSPLFAMKAPYWNQIRATQGSYSAGYGNVGPEQHLSLYGSGWAGLPTELGGQLPGRQSRFAGTPSS